MKTNKTHLAALLLSGAVICAAFTGCSTASETSPPDQNQVSNPTQSSTAPDNSSLLLQIEYYEGIIKDLEAHLLNEKEESYIAAATYKQTIAEFEAKIDSLNKKIEILSKQDSQTPSDPQFKEQVALTPKPSTSNNNESSVEFICNGLIITQYNGNKTTVNIPESLNGTVLTQIGEEAFKNSKVEKVILSDKIEYIDWFAFSGCKNLSEIYIPASVTYIGYGAFDNCSSFLVIKCPKGSYAEAYARSWGIIVITE